MVNVETGRGRWSVFADLTYLETSDNEQRPVFRVETRSDTTLLDTGVAFWPDGVGSHLSIIAGLRYSGFDNRYRFFLQDTEVSRVRNNKDYYDALLGVLREAGFSMLGAYRANLTIDSYVYGFTLQEVSWADWPPESADREWKQAQAFVERTDEAEFPNLMGVAQLSAGGQIDIRADFEIGLEAVLDGLERIRAAS